MIHNQEVNNDLQSRGIKFITDTDGKQFIDWNAVDKDDVVIIPAFGTTGDWTLTIWQRCGCSEIQHHVPVCWKKFGTDPKSSAKNNTPLSFTASRVMKKHAPRSPHGALNAPSVIVRDMEEATRLSKYITGESSSENFWEEFKGKFSNGFNPKTHFQKVGVVNQTTMLATETQAIADYFRQVMITKYGLENLKDHFADTRDTLCYATNDNQDSTYELLETPADLAIVVGGYNSSNTSHIVELCERKFPTYFINAETEIKSQNEIHHFDYTHKQNESLIISFLIKIRLRLCWPADSCPDTLVDRVMMRGRVLPASQLNRSIVSTIWISEVTFIVKAFSPLFSFIFSIHAQPDTVRTLSDVEIRHSAHDRPLHQIPAAIAKIQMADLQRFSNTSLLPALNAQPGFAWKSARPAATDCLFGAARCVPPLACATWKCISTECRLPIMAEKPFEHAFDFGSVSDVEVLKLGSSLYGAGTGGVVLLSTQSKTKIFNRWDYRWRLWPVALPFFGIAKSRRFQYSISYAGQQADGYRDHSKWSAMFFFNLNSIVTKRTTASLTILSSDL